jgi:hypothetical protein
MRKTAPQMSRLVAAVLAAMPLLAGAAAGEFSFVTGEVTLVKANGQRAAAAKGTSVDPGDRIITGTNGMAQLTMVDNARLSLRPSTTFQIDAYPQRPESTDGAVLNLLRGTLRTFTGLLASTNRDKYVMKTRVATVGIRGSGNILYACEGQDCDESIDKSAAQAPGGATINHTIEGSHAITNIVADRPGVPAQQGGATTLITGPGQTVLVAGFQPPKYIPTPKFIGETATNPTAAKQGPAEGTTGTTTVETRNFSPSDTPAVPTQVTTAQAVVGNNGLGFASDVDAITNAIRDPLNLQDIVISAGSPFSGQATESDITRSATGELRGYIAYGAPGIAPVISGGTSQDVRSIGLDGVQVTMGRYENAGVGFFGSGSSASIPGSIHWIMAPSGYPAYLADVLSGSVTYTLAANTSPTNQNNTTGTLNQATIFANFSNRTMGLDLAVTMPAAGSNAGGQWHLTTGAVPFSLNSFFASTSDNLTITNTTTNSTSNLNLTGSFEGSFVGAGLGGAILGYGISDRTSASSSNWNFVTGVAAFQGAHLDGSAPFREGRISDPNDTLLSFIRSYSTTDRPDEVTADATGRVTAFSAPFQGFGPHATYALGSAQVVQSGFDTTTGLVWGRWGGGTATITSSGNQTFNLNLSQRSLHYVFAPSQQGPTALPLSGTVSYDVVGSTSPTNAAGQVGTLGTATLDANFGNRTVSANVTIAIANQTWNGSASGMPIYREQYFSAYSGSPIAGVPNPNPLVISCSPNCGTGASGSFDGFFTGRTGQGAGMLYNLGGNQGALAFGRRGG